MPRRRNGEIALAALVLDTAKRVFREIVVASFSFVLDEVITRSRCGARLVGGPTPGAVLLDRRRRPRDSVRSMAMEAVRRDCCCVAVIFTGVLVRLPAPGSL